MPLKNTWKLLIQATFFRPVKKSLNFVLYKKYGETAIVKCSIQHDSNFVLKYIENEFVKAITKAFIEIWRSFNI